MRIDPCMGKFKRVLGLGQCIFFGVGSILGAGIYTLIGKVAGLSGNMIWLAFLVASITALFTAFSYAELSAMYPKTGGEYVYTKKAFGQKVGTAVGLVIATNGILSGATVAIGFAGYFTKLINIPTFIASLGIVVLLFLINVSGIKQSSLINIIFTIIEASGLILVIYVAFPSIGKVDYLALPDKCFNGFFAAAALGFFAYIGFEDIVKLAEETKNPEKNIPRALFISSIIVMVVYTLVAIAVVSVIPWQKLQNSLSPLADVVSTRFGATGIIIISIIALFSTSNTILSNMLSSARVFLNISKETRLLKVFSTISPKRKTPIAALILILIIMSAFIFIGKIEIIALIANLFIFTTFLLVNLSVIVLRIKEKNTDRPYRIPGSIKNIPIISILGILMTLLLLSYNIYSLFLG